MRSINGCGGAHGCLPRRRLDGGASHVAIDELPSPGRTRHAPALERAAFVFAESAEFARVSALVIAWDRSLSSGARRNQLVASRRSRNDRVAHQSCQRLIGAGKGRLHRCCSARAGPRTGRMRLRLRRGQWQPIGCDLRTLFAAPWKKPLRHQMIRLGAEFRPILLPIIQ